MSLDRRHSLTVFLTLILAGQQAQAACPEGVCCACPPVVVAERPRHNGWAVVETENFQVCCRGDDAAARHVARHAEALRREIAARFGGDDGASQWPCKCQIVVHTARSSYSAAVGRGSERTAGSSLVTQRHGQIATRRIDLLHDGKSVLIAALPHELTHVVLADWFVGRSLPRWADEGLAMLADSANKRSLHTADLKRAMTAHNTFPLAALLMLSDYPSADRWGVFYGQSLSLAEFLIDRGPPEQFVKFLLRAQDAGYDTALAECYGIANVAELDRLWRRGLQSGGSHQVAGQG